jgi:ESCRT-II complex subunit VPS22
MRKGAGISALSRQAASTSSYATLSSSITATQLAQLTSSLATFREQLLLFASKHRGDIRKDPAFRHQFQKMCSAIGVDPLAGGGGGGMGKGGIGGVVGRGGGGWWTELLGLGEWTYELAVQVVDVCVSTRERNGGVIEMGELIDRVERLRSGPVGSSTTTSRSGDRIEESSTSITRNVDRITPDDIHHALTLLRPLHAGYTTHTIGGTTFIRSVPRELDMDQSLLLVLAKDSGGRLREEWVREKTGWSGVRTRTALDDCVMREGLGWVDEQAGGVEKEVWIVAAIEFRDRWEDNAGSAACENA